MNMAQEIKKYNRNKNNCRLHPDRGVLMQLGLYIHLGCQFMSVFIL